MSRFPGGRTGLRFALTLAAFAVATALLFRDELVGPFVLPLRLLTARAVLSLIHLAGMEGVREITAIYHPGGFAYEVSRGCLGLVPAGFLLVGVLAHPGQLPRKAAVLALGVPLLLALNLARLLHLFYLGVYRTEWFHLAHQVLWQGGMVLAVFAIWYVSTGYLVGSGRPSRSAG